MTFGTAEVMMAGMENTTVVSVSREEFREMLGIESDESIKGVWVSYSPIMEEWSFIIDFYGGEDESN